MPFQSEHLERCSISSSAAEVTSYTLLPAAAVAAVAATAAEVASCASLPTA